MAYYGRRTNRARTVSRVALPLRLVAALVGIVAIAVAAATITSPTEPGDSGTDAVGPGEGDGVAPSPPPADPPAGGAAIPPFLEYLLLIVVAVLAVAVAWYLLAHRRELVKTLALAVAAVAIVLVLFTVLTRVAPDAALNATPTDTADGGELPGGESGDGEANGMPIGSLLSLLVIVAAIFAGALVLSRSDPSEVATAADDPEPSTAGPPEVGAAAGRAADRIRRADDVDNEVYRAWREMTRHLEVDRPETSTPREFAVAAVEAGMAREHVDDLTRLFEDVRYGHRETTDELEARAASILRTIEAAYTDEGGAAHAESTDSRRDRS